ncbi:beta strand repeat-containing protein [Devosia chinhatensis]|uniref:Uncharacterized protein n=1 Tax=Devosia chinhatensis TaxID=429727 RepID=A0A0F5FIF3_9HYPH|nr:calcium-binding protein [Devosia chinhatensis]KKB08616.1 hypothetical protein VE26_00510 [Devosia chinhatensis]
MIGKGKKQDLQSFGPSAMPETAAVKAAPALDASAIGIMPLEPRIMMDATLDLGLDAYFNAQLGSNATGALTDLLDMTSQLSDQFAAFSGLLTNQLSSALGSAADIFESAGANPYESKSGSAVDDAFAAIKSLGDAVADSILAGLSSDINAAMNAVVAQMKLEFRDATSSYFASLSTSQRDGVYSVIDAAVDQINLETLFSATSTFSSILASAEDQAISLSSTAGSAPSGAGPDFFNDAQRDALASQLRGTFIETIAGQIAGSVTTIDTTLSLTNVVSGGNTLVAFAQAGANVAVTVDFGQMLVDFASLFDSLGLSGDTVTNWAGMLADLGDTTFSFDLSAQTTNAGGGNFTTALTLANFDTSALSFGGAVNAAFLDDLNFTAGMFSAAVTAIDLAKFDIDFGGPVTLSFSTIDFGVHLNTGPGDFLNLMITEAGSANAVAFDTAAEYRFASIDFTAALDWGVDAIFSDLTDTIPSTFRVDGQFGLVGSSSTLTVAADAQVKAFDAGGTQIVPSAENQARLDAFTDTVLGMTRLDGSALMNALASAASGLDVLFDADIFNVDFPLLDGFNLSALSNVYQTIASLLLKPMEVDIGALGLTAGTDTAVNGRLMIEGIVADADTGRVFAEKGGEALAFTLNAVAGSLSHTYTISVNVPENGFASVRDYANALKAAIAAIDASELGAGKKLSAFLSIAEVRGDIEMRGAGLTGFSLGGAASTLALLGVAAANDTARSGTPLSGTSLTGLIDTGWMALFQFNLDLERTVTYADGSQEVVSYKTLTLSPEGGAWTAAGLVDQLNAFFNAAGITMSASLSGAGGIDFAVDDAAAASAYAKTGTSVTETAFSFAIAGAKASVATSVEVLQAYINQELGAVVPGAALDIDIQSGEVILRLPNIAFAVETAFEAALAANLGPLAELDVQAAFALAAKFSLGFAIGADLKGLYGAMGNADAKVSDFIFLENVSFAAEVSALAEDITGKGRLGIVEVELGGDGVNQIAVGGRLIAGLIGQDAEGDYSNRVTFANLMAQSNSAAGIASLIGTFDLVGTVDTGNGDAFALIELNAIRVGISGVNIGIENDAVRSLTASLHDVFKPTDWRLDIDSPVVGLIAGLGTNDFVDTLYNSLILVDQLLNGLAGDLAFLGADIPVLGISLLDAMNFAKDLAGELQAFKNNPNGGLSEISASLASAFGLGSNDLKLVWDGTNSVFYVSLGLSFLDAPLNYDFQLDLAELLGDMVGSDSAIANLLSVASSLGNVTGDGRIVLDASLGFDLTFGVDLSSVMGTNVGAVTTATALAAMSGISQLSYNTANSGHNGRDMLISLVRTGAGAPQYIDVKVELDSASTVGEAVALIHAGLASAGQANQIGIEIVGKDANGNPVRLMIDANNRALADFGMAGLVIESIGFVDVVVTPVDFAGASTLFGTVIAVEADVNGDAGTFTGAVLDSVDAAAAYKFGVIINGSNPIEIAVAAQAGRDAAGLVAALQAALASKLVSRADLGLGLPSNIKLDKLLSFGIDANNALTLSATNFAQTIGKDQIDLTLTGSLTGQTSTISVSDLGGSNLARALGFEAAAGSVATGTMEVQGKALEARLDDNGVSAFIVTRDIVVNGVQLGGTGIAFDFIAGVTDGLNMKLALGPLSVAVVDGRVLIGDGAGGDAYVRFGINDGADSYLSYGDADDGRVYFGAIGDMFTGTAPVGLSDLFTFDAKAALEIVLPLEDSLGLLQAVDDARIAISGDLFVANGSFANATGALVAIADPDLSVGDFLTVDIVLPSFSEMLENLNPWAIINDPILLTNGLDMILSSLDKTLRSVIRAMNLPIVGDAMTQGLTVFNDIAYAILNPIQEAANTPNPDGTMPTTIDLIERVVNGALKSLFGIEQDVIRAVLTEDMDNPSIVAEIFLDGFTIFQAALDVGFNLGIPGLHLDVGQNSALMFEIVADINIAFGIDKNGFFFLNDTDNAEIVIQALVKTSDDFTASASLGLVGMALTANQIQGHGFGGDIRGAVIGGRIEIDLFTSLGKTLDRALFDDEVSTYGRDNGYEKIVRLNELSTAKSASGEGTRMVSISGVFEVHVDMHLTTSVVNPVTGNPINELPSALADFVFDARYEIGGELEMQRLEFQDVGLYAGDFLAENVMPVLLQINEYISPIAAMVQFMKTTGIGDFTIYELIYQAVRYVNPAALFIFEAVDTVTSVINFIESLGPEATVYFGSFSLLSPASATGVVDTSSSKAMANLRPGSGATQSSSLEMSGAITNNKPGIGFNLLIFNDVSNVLNLITGNLADVELFEIDITLLDFTLNIDLAAAVKSAVSFLPGKVIDVLFGGFTASFYVHAGAGLTVGYDLYGIAQFLGNGNALDILDGMYLDANRPLLELDASFNVGIGINLGIIKAGLGLSGYFSLEISMNDPNDDGKLRFGELIWVIDKYSVLDLFEGEIKLGLDFNVYFKLDLFFFSVGGSWNWNIIDFSTSFGRDFTANPNFMDTSGGVTTLNMGATAGKQVGGNAVDGNDVIEFNGNRVYINGRDAGLVGGSTVLIYAGQGNNVIDVSGLSSSIAFQIVTGDGDDTIIVGNSSGIISTGAGNDQVLYGGVGSMMNFSAFGLMGFGAFFGGGLAPNAPATSLNAQAMPTSTAPTSNAAVRDRVPTTSNQDLLILSRGGATIDMSGSTANMIVVATALDIVGDRGERVELAEWVQAKYQGGTPNMAEVRQKIDRAMLTYTADSQTRADAGNSVIRTGTGNDIIFAGRGNDIITSEGGNNIIFGGAGDDRIEVRGSGNNWIEGGAGADLIIGSEGNDTIMGWGRYDATTTSAEYAAALPHLSVSERAAFAELVRTLLLDDGNDWIEGNGGDDILVGNGGGRNVLIGGDGDDVLLSGTGSDILAGGDIAIATANGTIIDRAPGFNPIGVFTITSVLGADGNDRLYGSNGNNILIGGGGEDWLEGVGGSNVLIGDFAEISLSGTATILSAKSLFIDASEQGNDIIQGGALADVVIGGGGQDLISGGNGRNVLIGDHAELTSTNLFEGVTRLVSLKGSEDDADTIYSGINTSIIVAGGSRQTYGDFISTGHLYGAPSTSAVQGNYIFADYGDLQGALRAPSIMTTVFDAGDDDVIQTGAGNDVIFGGAGNDTISSGDGDDIIFGDTGTYMLNHTGRQGVTLSTDHNALNNPLAGQTGNSATLFGNDVIAGGNGNNIVFGGGGADRISTGTGLDIILGDLGNVLLYKNAATGQADIEVVANEPISGDDTWNDEIIAGRGDDIVFGGGGSDIIAGGAAGIDEAGRLIAFGDFGRVTAAIAGMHSLAANETGRTLRYEAMALASLSTDRGGDDTIYGGGGLSFIFGGFGSDVIEGGNGDHWVFGDSGEIDNVGLGGTRQGQSIAFDQGGNDTIRLGNGRNVVVGGLGDDTITLGDGGNLVIGDNGQVRYGVNNDRIERLYAQGLATILGGKDIIDTGAGDDVVMGGQDDDRIDGGAGNDILVGDWAIVDFVNSSLTTQSPDHGGHDLIAGGEGNDIVIGGWGNDRISGGGDANVMVGDYASFTWRGRFDLHTIVLDAIESFGDDLIYSNYDPTFGSGMTADGNSISIGGRGNDTIEGGNANDLLFGDWGVFAFISASSQPGVAAFDRLMSAESNENWAFGHDRLNGGPGRDIIIGGDGNDIINGGTGQDLIAGDAAIYINYHNGWELLETRFPFDGGDDIIDGGPGLDIIISGFFNFGTPGAGDFLYGNTIEDFMMGTSGSILIHNGKVIKFNYLGLETKELISSNQLRASAGVLMRPSEIEPSALMPLASTFLAPTRPDADVYAFDPESEISRTDAPLVLQVDVVMREILLDQDMLGLIDIYRQGAISVDDLEQAIREAVLAMLADRYGQNVPTRVLEMLERYIDLLIEQIDQQGAASDEGAVQEDSSVAPTGGA